MVKIIRFQILYSHWPRHWIVSNSNTRSKNIPRNKLHSRIFWSQISDVMNIHSLPFLTGCNDDQTNSTFTHNWAWNKIGSESCTLETRILIDAWSMLLSELATSTEWAKWDCKIALISKRWRLRVQFAWNCNQIMKSSN